MPNFDPLSRAKKVAEQAANAALEAKEKAAAKIDEAGGLVAAVREQASDVIGELKESAFEGIVDVTDSAAGRIRELVEGLNRQLPVLREAGYTLTDVAFAVGLGCKMVATFAPQQDISQERIDAIIEQHRDSKVTTTLLRTLYSAYKLQNSIQIGGMKPRGVSLDIGLPPGVIFKFA